MGRRPAATARRVGISAALCLTLLLLQAIALPGIAFAALVNPDTLELKSVQAFRHLIEPNDFLLLVHYNIYYSANQPDDLASTTFMVRLLDGNTTLGSTTPYPFYNDGYDEGCSALYWSAGSAPLWGGNYTARIDGNPTMFSAPSMTQSPLTSGDYTTETTQDAIRDDLKSYLLAVANDLEVDWGMTGQLHFYSSAGTVFSPAGEAYFASAIRGLRNMCPSLFSLQLIEPTVQLGNYTQAQAEAYKARFDGTPVGDAIDGIGTFLGGISAQLVTTMLCVLGLLGVVVLCAIKHQKATPGFLIGFPILLVATPMGMFSFPLLGVICLLSVLNIGYFWFFRHGSG